MRRRFGFVSRVTQTALLVCSITAIAGSAQAQSFGLNFQNGNYGFGPWNIVDFGSAYGVAGDDWYNTAVASSSFDPNSVNGAVSFSSPSMNGAAVKFVWESSNAVQANTINAYGWSHAGEPTHPSNGLPQSGEEAVLGGWVFAEYNAASGQGAKIHIKISGLDAVASSAGVPLSYQVKLLASNDWGTADHYTPATVEDNSGHSEVLNFNLLDLDNDSIPDHPRWNGAYFSSGGMADSSILFSGNTLDITIAGPNESGVFDQPGYTRSALAGLTVRFVPPAAVVPEPPSILILAIGCCVLISNVRRAFLSRLPRRIFSSAFTTSLCLLATSAYAASPSFGVNFDNNYFSGLNTSDFPSAFGVPGQDWYNTVAAVSDSDPGSDATGVVSFSPSSLSGASLSMKWTSDRFWGGEPSPVYGFTHANVDPSDPTGQTGLANAGQPLTGEEAVLKGSLVGTYTAATGFGQKIEITINGLAAAASAAGVPLQYQVKLMASEIGLPKSFYLPPIDLSHNPAPGFAVRNFSPAKVADNAAHSETVNLTTQWADTPTWNPPPVDSRGPFYSSAVTGDSTTTFTGDSLTITLDGPFDFGGAWGTAGYGVTRLSGVAVYFVGAPVQTGDFDSDGDVDGADFIAWQTHYPTASGATRATGDADGNGTVDATDFAIWQSSFPGSPSSAAPVPEPTGLLLAAFGACCFAGRRIQRKIWG